VFEINLSTIGTHFKLQIKISENHESLADWSATLYGTFRIGRDVTFGTNVDFIGCVSKGKNLNILIFSKLVALCGNLETYFFSFKKPA